MHISAIDTLVGLRNAEGIDRLKPMLEDDLDDLYRHDALPEAIGVFLDSDDEPQERRFNGLRDALLSISGGSRALQPADKLAVMGIGSPRVGIFAFPSPGVEGALEDLLLEIGKVPYADLCSSASEYVNARRAHVDSDSHKDWKALKGASGIKKATFAAATAVLKPGRGAVATIEDNRWVSDATRGHAALAPCLVFLRDLLATADVPAKTDAATPRGA